MKPNTKRYVISIGVGLLITVLVALSRNIFAEDEINRVLISLVDSFFISGICLTCVGALVFVSNEGMFYMISYGFSLFFNIRRRDINGRKYKDFYEYKSAKEEKQHSCAYLLLVGLGFLAVSALFLIWVKL